MNTVIDLIEAVGSARGRALDSVSGLTSAQSTFRPGDGVLSVLENLEHLVLAEVSGVSKIWQAAEDARSGSGPRDYGQPKPGSLNARQRLEFLRFRIERHIGQIERLKEHSAFPR